MGLSLNQAVTTAIKNITGAFTVFKVVAVRDGKVVSPFQHQEWKSGLNYSNRNDGPGLTATELRTNEVHRGIHVCLTETEANFTLAKFKEKNPGDEAVLIALKAYSHGLVGVGNFTFYGLNQPNSHAVFTHVEATTAGLQSAIAQAKLNAARKAVEVEAKQKEAARLAEVQRKAQLAQEAARLAAEQKRLAEAAEAAKLAKRKVAAAKRKATIAARQPHTW